MKKLILVILAAFTVTVSAFAKPVAYNETSEENWSTMSYRNVQIVKILDSKDGYVVIYQKGKYGVGETVIPKSWAKGSPESPRKLKIRFLPSGVLTNPSNRNDSVWGVISYKQSVEGTDKETLEEIEF